MINESPTAFFPRIKGRMPFFVLDKNKLNPYLDLNGTYLNHAQGRNIRWRNWKVCWN